MEYKTVCPECRKNGRDRAGDNLHVYGKGKGSFCWSCGFCELSDEEKERRGLSNFIWDERSMSNKEFITQEEIDRVKEYTGVKGSNSRNITDETYGFYGVRFEYDTSTRAVTKHYYPVTEDYKAAGYKIRILPKDFTSIGKFGKTSDLFGQWRFKNSNSKNVVLVAGEVDTLSAFQMLEDYRKSKGHDYDPTPVVSSVIGESGSHTQIQLQYDWLNRFEKIIVCYDQDEAGQEAVKKLVKVIPKGKMYVMDLPLKDSNDMLVQGKSKEWLNAYYKARPYTPDGIVPSSSLMEKVLEGAKVLRIPLPPFMKKLEDMMAGGIPLGVIVTLSSGSGTGKSSICDEILYYWIFNSPYKMGVVSLESDSAQYGTKLLSRHIGRKIDLISSVEDKIKLLESKEVQDAAKNLFCSDTGEPRWLLIEDRDSKIEEMKEKISSLIVSCGCKIIVLDPISDILEGASNEEQALFSKWMKGMCKSHNVTFLNVAHTRKLPSSQKAASQGGQLTEEDMMGSSSLYKSSACNLIFTRNKESEDEVERNTTYMKMTKCRWSGRSAIAGVYYYDNETHTIHDKESYFKDKSGINF